MRMHDTFTMVFKVWKDIATLPAVRDAVVNIFGHFMDIRLGNSDNWLIQALTERWWPTTHTFLFPCVEIGVTPLDFTMLTSLSIDQYPTLVPYDDTWSILSNARQLLPNIDFSHIKSGNVSIAHLRTYLTVAADREDDITIARVFILFMMGHLWFQMAKDTVPLGYLTAVNNLDSAAQYDWGSAILASLYHGLDTAVTVGGAITGFVQLLLYLFYLYCGVGHPIVKEEVKYPAYPRLRAWERGNRKKTIDQVTGVVRIPSDPLLSMLPHISPAALNGTRQAGFLDYSQRMGNIDLFGPTTLRNGITPVVVTLASVHSMSQDFSLPGEAEGPDPGWYMVWTGRREMLPIARLRDPPPMSSSYGSEELWHLTHGMRRLVLAESTQDVQRLQEVQDELAIACRQIDSIDHQLYAHDR
ncbi:hypothetical protein GIB67_002289 [Kingdonia uniflora]|uniref:Aminotransferase-like plant mobile domain-containing protein n=1 Tax=Kingdonia uniflora TaxID=39325 RepID=A0A7J7KX39_9MAGN|nr:hypothetical protein GIB67_002289 [Kingdonia uniflora]